MLSFAILSNRFVYILLIGFHLLTFTNCLAQTTRFVSTTGTNTNPATATSWATSTTNLQGAINSLSATGGQVWVAAGVYKPGGNANTNRNISFQMRNNVAVYGGFVGNETLLSQRPVINPIAGPGGAAQPSSTTFSGEIGNPSSTTDNSYHVITNTSLNSTARLDGVVVTAGNASGVFPDNIGGAIYYNNSLGTPTGPSLTNCSFLNNSATDGGAIYTFNSSPILTNCSFLNNNATANGGAIYNNVNSNPSVANCSFQSNTATTSGGAIYNSESNPSLTNCSFQNNLANGNGGAIANANANNSLGTPTGPSLTNCSFLNNTANGLGGAIRSNNSIPSLINCVLFGNGGANTISNANSSTLTASYSLFDQSVTGYTSLTGNLTTTVSPFASATSVALTPCSPAINAGDPTSQTATSGPFSVTALPATDVVGNPRIFGSRIDMGAIEFGATPGPLNITLTAAPSFTITTGNAATLTASGGTSYSWSNGQSTSAISVSVAGTYSVTATAGSCSSVSTVTVTVSAPPCGTVIYVTQNGAGLQNGTSWANALTGNQLQLAITTAASCGGSRQVWVATGVYKPGGNTNTNRTISFQMANNVAIYGGFVGNETALSQRPLINLSTPSSTTLSGEIGNPTSTTDNSYHVFNHPFGLNLSNTARLDGVVITGGNANGSFPDDRGGAMYNNGNLGTPTGPSLTNCSFLNNNATANGGAIHNTQSSPNLTNCSFQNNQSNNNGGAIFNFQSNAILTNCSFQSNTATSGGAIYISSSNPGLVNCNFLNNRANSNGGAIANDISSSPSLTNCSFLNNTATGLGGAIRNFNSTPSLTNCILFGNGGANTISNANSSTLTASYSLFDASVTGYTSAGTGNLTTTVSPFASATSTTLAPTSPAINAGNPATTSATVGTTDLAGNPRFVNTLIDMGAYEFQGILEVFTLKDGLWNDASVWSAGRLPLATERVWLKHAVTIPTGHLALSGTLIYDPVSKLIYATGGGLKLGQ